MDLPFKVPDLRRGHRSTRVAASWASSFAGRILEIEVGLSRSITQHIDDDLGPLPEGQYVSSALLADEHRGLSRKPSPGYADDRTIPQVISQNRSEDTPDSSDAAESLRGSENESAAVVNFWNSLSLAEQQAFRSKANKRVFAAGARLMQEGQQANHVAVILDGWTEIRVRKNGGERVVARRGRGQLIGERAALQISVRSATVVAIQPVVALVMHTEDFATFVSGHPWVLGIVENQIYTRMKEEPARSEPDQADSADSAATESWMPAERPGDQAQAAALRPHRPWLSGENCTVLRTDVVAFGADERNDEDRCIIRRESLRMMQSALGALWGTCRCEDRGDGLLIVAPASLPTAQVMEQLLTVLPGELRRHNRTYSDSIRIQLRVAFDVGPVTEDATGMSGKSIIRVSRLLDASIFKQAIVETGTLIGVIASPFVFETAISHGGGSLDPTHYKKVAVRVKETRMQAWMRLIEPSGISAPLHRSLTRAEAVRWVTALTADPRRDTPTGLRVPSSATALPPRLLRRTGR